MQVPFEPYLKLKSIRSDVTTYQATLTYTIISSALKLKTIERFWIVEYFPVSSTSYFIVLLLCQHQVPKL